MPGWLLGQPFTISGFLTARESGETLTGATVIVADQPNRGAVSNAYGFYSLSLPPGTYQLVFAYLGYTSEKRQVTLTEDLRLNISLQAGVELEEIVVKGTNPAANVTETQLGKLELPGEQLRKIPALLGEADVLKALQRLPGVLAGGEGSAGFFVRGGGADQNLVLLDEATVYNSGHLLGFFSIFNADVVKNAVLIKGGIPAQYGSRLSSVVDVQMKEGNDQAFSAVGGIGLIASRLTLQGPLLPERSSYIFSARRTYALDLAQPFIRQTAYAGTNYFFYDVNAKINHRFSDRDRVFLSAYFGRDVLRFRSSGRDLAFDLPYGNATATLRWNHLFSNRLFANTVFTFNDYQFQFSGGQDDFSVAVNSGVRDWNAKFDFDFFPNAAHRWKFGAQASRHRLTPNVATAQSGDQTFSNNLTPLYALEGALYLADDFQWGKKWQFNAGLRLSWFQLRGPYPGSPNSPSFERGEAVKVYAGPEPRLSMRYQLNPTASLKLGLTGAYQYLHLVSNSASTLPADVWVPSSPQVKPQYSTLLAVGFFQNLANNTWEASVETYYKDLRNQIDYRENYVNNPANNLEAEFVFGRGKAYGIEWLIRKKTGRLNGWLGYTLSRATRQFPAINNGQTFPAIFDRPHDLSLVVNYQLNARWELSGVFVYGTGRAYTPVTSLYFIGNTLNQEFGARNSARLKDYHRIDLGATYTPGTRPNQDFRSSWTISIYNAYNRLNPFFLYYDFETDLNRGTAEAKAIQFSLFPAIPSITWNFEWQPRTTNHPR